MVLKQCQHQFKKRFHLKINAYGQTLARNINAVLVKQCPVFLIGFRPDLSSLQFNGNPSIHFTGWYLWSSMLQWYVPRK